jgi:hypothetical protein
MAGIFAVAGATIDIGQPLAAQSADFVEADFAGQSWVNIGWPESIGSFGDESSEITFEAISEGRTQKLKGTRNAGNLELVCGVDYEDQGQVTLRGAETETFDYAFRVTFNDAPSGGTASIRYFIAKVMSAREQLDGANNVIRLNATLGINSNIVRVPASA